MTIKRLQNTETFQFTRKERPVFINLERLHNSKYGEPRYRATVIWDNENRYTYTEVYKINGYESPLEICYKLLEQIEYEKESRGE